MNAKALSPVVAVSLLLVVSVLAVVNFQTWFGSFSSGVFSDVETKGDVNDVLKINGINNNILYLYSEKNDTFNILKVFSEDGTLKCEYNDYYFSDKVYFQGLTMGIANFDGGSFEELSQYEHSHTLYGSTNCSSSGLSLYGCYFDGDNDGLTFNTKSFHNVDQISIASWIKLNIVDVNRFLINFAGSNSDVSLRVLSSGRLMGGIEAGATSNYLTIDNPLNTDEWYFVVFSYNLSDIAIYINGVLNASTTHSVGGPLSWSGSDDSAWIFGTGGGSGGFNGSLDEIAIYSFALPENHIWNLYQYQKSKFIENRVQGMISVDVSLCNLTKGQSYDVVAFTNSGKVEQKVIAK